MRENSHTLYFCQNNSPGRTYDNDAFNVDPDGDVVNDYWPVGRSFGRSSPCLEHDRSDTYGVNVNGYVTDDYDVNWDSYG